MRATRWIDRILVAAALIAIALVASGALAQSPGNFSTLSTTGAATLNGDVLMCSGHPWLDVRCPSMAGGAVGDGSHDDTAAVQAAINAGIANNWPVHVPAGTYKVTAKLTIDYAGQASNGFRLISEGATIDGRSIASGPVLQVECSGGSPGSPANCFYFREEGALFVNADTPAYAVVIGKADFSDAHNSLKIGHLIVNNASTAAAAGGLQLNFVLDSDIFSIADSAGGAAGIALEQTQFSRISGAGSAAATGGTALLLEQGYNYANTIFAFDMENAPTCLGITFNHDGMNSFVSPYFACTTAVNATASTHNVLINPTYAGNVVNRGPQSSGVEVIGSGNWARWQFPATASYTASPIDDKTVLSSFNAPGAALSVTLPAPSAVNAGWSMGFATDNGKGLTVSPSSGLILAGGKTLSSVTLGPGNYEYLQLQSDGNNYRVVTATRSTLATNGMESRDWPGNWLYPSSAGYAATLGDNGTVVSSFNTAAGLTVTLPSTTGLPSGWSMGFATDDGKALTVQVNGTNGGNILYPLINHTEKTSLSLAGSFYEFVTLQYDGGGNFRVEQVTPATAQQLGLAGIGGLSRWLFPAASAYNAGVADNGTAISAFNSPLGYLTVTLPSIDTINNGWTLAIANDNNKLAAVQVNATNGGKLLYPGSGATVTSLQLAAGNFETAVLQFDGSNFRVMQLTPASAASIGMAGGTCTAKWSFPAVSSYAAGPSDCGTTISNFNSPIASLSVTLPSTTAIAAGWSMSFASDNNKTLSLQVNATSGGNILIPGTRGAQTALTLYGANYELVTVQFDGTNFRIMSATPATASANGMFPAIGTPASSTAACQTGQIEFDASYLYACTAANTWKRTAWSSF
ncbi:MAG TPA: glycosyl hydrolase family 28-related protein [Stellaceae bacterium]|nr:glycosyl hydrolase family 28-related protein [Stellaceae bacterium]